MPTQIQLQEFLGRTQQALQNLLPKAGVELLALLKAARLRIGIFPLLAFLALLLWASGASSRTFFATLSAVLLGSLIARLVHGFLVRRGFGLSPQLAVGTGATSSVPASASSSPAHARPSPAPTLTEAEVQLLPLIRPELRHDPEAAAAAMDLLLSGYIAALKDERDRHQEKTLELRRIADQAELGATLRHRLFDHRVNP